MSISADSIDAVLKRAVVAFRERFGREPTVAAAAPGRVNLIGEHTDYNDGFVLPVAIDRWMVCVADPADDSSQSTIRSVDLGCEVSLDLTEPFRPFSDASERWANYPIGVVDVFKRHGATVSNLNIVFAGSVPIGAGLSSSAALEMATACVLELTAGRKIDPQNKVRWCREAEHTFAGVPCGIMDQMISVMAKRDHALLIDCRSEAVTPIAMPSSDQAVLLVLDTKVKHELTVDEYGLRREQCRLAVVKIRRLTGKCEQECRSLRDVSMEDIDQVSDSLDPLLLQRARHVVTENDRVLKAVEALGQSDLDAFGEIMFAGHDSLRDDYEVSRSELDFLVEAARGVDGVFGCRMTGAGFGGCVIALCRSNVVNTVSQRLSNGFSKQFGRKPEYFKTTAVHGAYQIDLT